MSQHHITDGPIDSETEALATLGEAAQGIAHDVNNILNAMVLHLSVAELKATDEVKARLQDARQEVANAAAKLRVLQSLRADRRHAAAPVRLATVLDAPGLTELPAVVAPTGAARRLFRLLPQRMARAFGDGYRVRPVQSAERVGLAIEPAGDVTAAELTGFLTPFDPNRADADEIGRIAVHSLAKSVGAKIGVEVGADGRPCVAVTWPVGQ